MIFQDDPNLYCPIERQEDKVNHCTRMVAAYDYHDLEKFGLLKLDILGLATLNVIDNTAKLLSEPIDYYNLPDDDKDTLKLYADGNSTGIFQTESPGMKHLEKEIAVDCFEDVIALCALYRPGPLKSGMVQQYIDCKHGKEPEYPHPDLKPILIDTYGVMVYQEQAIQIVQLMANMTPGEADNFRRIIGRKIKEEVEPAVKQFVERSIANGYSKEVSEHVAKWLSDAAEYIFNKSHSGAYGKVSYITAYLKTHYPVEYMTSLLNVKIGNIDKTVEYIREARRLDIKILPPSVAYSKSKYTIENNGIRFGLNAIKGVGSSEFVPANNFDEFITNNPGINNGTLEALIKAGAFPESRGLNLAKLAWIKENKDRIKQCNNKIEEFTQKNNQAKVNEWKLKLSLVPQFDNQPLIVNEPQLEREVLGMYLTTSPMDLFVEQLTTNTWTWEEFLETGDGGHVIVGGMVKKIKLHTDKRGNQMAFLTLECYMGDIIDITFFSSLWSKWGDKIHEDGIIRIDGKKNEGNKMLANSVAIYR
jgi:DNA polymerase-3 subunit alpha